MDNTKGSNTNLCTITLGVVQAWRVPRIMIMMLAFTPVRHLVDKSTF